LAARLELGFRLTWPALRLDQRNAGRGLLPATLMPGRPLPELDSHGRAPGSLGCPKRGCYLPFLAAGAAVLAAAGFLAPFFGLRASFPTFI